MQVLVSAEVVVVAAGWSSLKSVFGSLTASGSTGLWVVTKTAGASSINIVRLISTRAVPMRFRKVVLIFVIKVVIWVCVRFRRMEIEE